VQQSRLRWLGQRIVHGGRDPADRPIEEEPEAVREVRHPIGLLDRPPLLSRAELSDVDQGPEGAPVVLQPADRQRVSSQQLTSRLGNRLHQVRLAR